MKIRQEQWKTSAQGLVFHTENKYTESYNPDSFAELQILGLFQKCSVWKQIHLFA